MSFLRILPAQFSLLLITAHFMRLGFPMLLVLPLMVLLMLGLLVPWSQFRAILTLPLAVYSIIWALTTWNLVGARLAEGQPWMRLAAILSAVTLFTAWSAWLVWDSRRFDLHKGKGASAPQA